MAGENTQAEVAQPVSVVDYSDHGLRLCPNCGSSKYHRSRRTTLDRLLSRPPMASCEKCGSRFPYPKRVEKPRDSFQLGEEAAAVPHFVEEKGTSRIGKANFEPKATNQVNVIDSSKGGGRHCPFCGSTAYRRSRRTTWERFLFRPRMARCKNCRKRFPYPRG